MGSFSRSVLKGVFVLENLVYLCSFVFLFFWGDCREILFFIRVGFFVLEDIRFFLVIIL